MNRGETSESIPLDLVNEIFSRLPAKSIARFRCVSKLWDSILGRPYFTELFMTRSRARPRLFFAVKRCKEWRFYSTPQTPDPNIKSYYTTFHMKLFDKDWVDFHCFTYGLIYFSGMITNPYTRRYVILPKPRGYTTGHGFLGFDPIDKQFKVLFFKDNRNDDLNRMILTLGTGSLIWKRIHCPFKHEYIGGKGVCINGVVYCVGCHKDGDRSRGIVCFDVRSETFKFVAAECCDDKLINCNGKLGVVSLKKGDAGGVVLSLWILEDVEKQEWSKYVYTLWDGDIVDWWNVFVVGMIATGEIVLSSRSTSKPFYVFYFNPKRHTLQRLEIQGLRECYDDVYETVSTFMDHVEDLDIIDAKQFKSDQIVKKKPKSPLRSRTGS